MARKHLFLFSWILIALLVSCASIPDDLVVMDSDDVEISMSRGEMTATITNKGIEYQILGTNVDDGEGSFLVSITNNTDKPFDFSDSDIVILGAKHKWGLWKTLETWDAKAYYNGAVRDNRSGVFWASFAGALLRVDALLSVVSDRRSSYGYVTYGTRTHGSGDLVAAALISRAAVDSVRSNGDDYLKYLEDNLLFSSTIAPGETYVGWVFFDAPRRYDYYAIEINSGRKYNPLKVVMQRESL